MKRHLNKEFGRLALYGNDSRRYEYLKVRNIFNINFYYQPLFLMIKNYGIGFLFQNEENRIKAIQILKMIMKN